MFERYNCAVLSISINQSTQPKHLQTTLLFLNVHIIMSQELEGAIIE